MNSKGPDNPPLLTGELASQARSELGRIASSLLASGPSADQSLANGNAGAGLFLEYFSFVEGAPNASSSFVEPAVESLVEDSTGPGLFAGFTGVAWVLRHIENLRGNQTTDCDDIHASLCQYIKDRRYGQEWDLVTGLVGIGVYALEHLPDDGALSCLELVLQHLVIGLQRSAAEPWLIFSKQGMVPRRVDLGLAHGVPGLIAFLARAQKVRREFSGVGETINRSVVWLLSRRQPNLRFPYFDGLAEVSRDAWCYGDPGISLALLAAGRSANNAVWCFEARAQAEAVISRSVAESGVRDAGLCHGGAGLAHMFHRLFRLTGEDAFRRASVSWFERTLDALSANNHENAYSSSHSQTSMERTWTPDAGFLTGASGIGLALLSAVADQDLAWDRLLLAPQTSTGSAE